MATYYVSTTGNNTNTGLSPISENAWLTITYAIAQLVAGDTLKILPGTFNENLYIEKNGTSGNLITIQAYDYVDKPQIIASSNSAVVRLRGSYLTLSGLKINTVYSQTHISCETGNSVIIEKNEIDAKGYLGLHGIEVSSASSTDIVVRYNKLKNIEGIPIKIGSNGAEIYYNLADGFLVNATTQNIQLYVTSSGVFNIYNNTLVGGRSYGIYIGHTGATGNIKNNIVSNYGIANSGAYGLWIDPVATINYDYNLITCNCLDSSKTVSGGTDGGHNLVGSEYFPNFNSLRNKGKVYLYNDDYLDKIETCAGIANAYGLPITGSLIYSYNSAEENLATRMIALYDNENEVCNHTKTHQSLGIGVIDYVAEVDWMRTWLSTSIPGYIANTIVYPGGLVSEASITWLNDNGYTCGRIGSLTNPDLRAIDIFETPCADINKFLIDRTELGVKNFVKQHALAMACSPSISGILTHALGGGAGEPTEEEFGWMCEALSECLDYVDVQTLETLSNEIRNLGNWSSLDGKRWTRTNYVDNSDYRLKTSSIAVRAGIDVGLLQDIENLALSGTPSIGAYSFLEGEVYMAEYYVTTTGNGSHDGTSEANAWDWSEMVTAINDGTVAGDSRINLKNNATFEIGDTTINVSGTVYAWKTIEGYTTNPGDGGIVSILRTSGASHLLNFNAKNYWRLKNIAVNGASSGAINIIIGAQSQLENVESSYAGSYGIYSYALTQVLNCYSHHNVLDGFYDGSLFNCLASLNGEYGIHQVSDNCHNTNCISAGNGKANFFLLKGTCLNPISNGGSQHGIHCYYTVLLMNAIIINHTSGLYYALHFSDVTGDSALGIIKNINFYNNAGLGNTNKLEYIDTYYTLDPQFNSPATFDYTRTGNNLDGLGFSDVGNRGVNYTIDIGVNQRKIVPTYAPITDVRFGVDRGDGSTGTLDLPSVNDVQNGVQFDNTTKEGVFVSPAETNVKTGITYGATSEYTGSYDEDYPLEINVRDGIVFGNSTKEGNLGIPTAADVRDGVGYGANETEFEGVLDLPSVNDVQDSVLFDNSTKEGNLVLPTTSQVKDGVTFGSLGTEFEGNIEIPTVANVRKDVTYGINGTELTGLLNLPSVNEVQEGVSFDNSTKSGVFEVPTEAQVELDVGFGANGTEFTGTFEGGLKVEGSITIEIR